MLEVGMKVVFKGDVIYIWQILPKSIIILNLNKKPHFKKIDKREFKGLING
ncbi:hypothetical protein [Caminibacter pacificus]|jgi:hypothetical protein